MTHKTECPAAPTRDQLELDRRMWVQQLLNAGLEELRVATFGRPCR
jgi:hypothetical protein